MSIDESRPRRLNLGRWIFVLNCAKPLSFQFRKKDSKLWLRRESVPFLLILRQPGNRSMRSRTTIVPPFDLSYASAPAIENDIHTSARQDDNATNAKRGFCYEHCRPLAGWPMGLPAAY
jgi:hypothetical protein